MSKNGHSIRVLAADGSAFIRNRLSMMLMKCSELQVVEIVMNGHDVIEQAKRTQPDVMMLDIEMPSMNGFGSIRSHDGPSHISHHHGRCPHGGGSWRHASSACTRSS
jgi:DNA-binding NarL/FixJ family response regulator